MYFILFTLILLRDMFYHVFLHDLFVPLLTYVCILASVSPPAIHCHGSQHAEKRQINNSLTPQQGVWRARGSREIPRKHPVLG